MTASAQTEKELVRRAWRVVFQRSEPSNGSEEALFQHLQASVPVASHGHENGPRKGTTDEKVVKLLCDDINEKLVYLDPSWGYVEAVGIASRVDECAIALQEKTKREFLDPLNWDLQPHQAVIATVKAVLLLFDMKYPLHLSDDELWKNYWGLWVVKNIDAHTSGWEWSTTNEPTGLFTKPYELSATFLPQVKHLIESTRVTPPSHRCWHRMAAYACLREWADACVAYVHLKHHYLPGFQAYDEVETLLSPPRRTPQANVWFKLTTAEEIDYFYNRVLQEVVLEKPEDFDGGNVTTIPSIVMELVEDALRNDHATRLELERRSHQKVHDQLLAEDEWVQCVNFRTQELYYYSFRHYRTSNVPPPSGVFLLHTESVAYRAVLSLQTAYRKRRLQQKLQVKRAKRASLPVFSAITTKKKYY